MGLVNKLLDSLVTRNAVQQTDGFRSTELYTRNFNPVEFFAGINKSGKYDNFYGDANAIVQEASNYPFYYKDAKNRILEPKRNAFAYYLNNPNDEYSQRKVLQQIYTELMTKGASEIFIWRKDGRGETSHFVAGRKYNEADFRGITLVSGYDRSKLSESDRKDIITITHGVSQSNVFMGYSPSQASQSWRAMQDEMSLHMTAFAKNGGMPLGEFIITAPSPEEYVKLRSKLEDKITGAKNNGKVLYSYRPSEAKQSQIEWVQYSSRDVQDYTGQLEFADKKMTQNWGVPNTIKGTNDNENYATARVAEQVFIKYKIKSVVNDVLDQLNFQLQKRFNLSGEVAVTIVMPEVADESLVKIQATTQQVALFDQKIAEGYTPASIVAAYSLPESFLLLERDTNSTSRQNTLKTPKNSQIQHNHSHSDEKEPEYVRHYQNALSKDEKKRLEDGFQRILDDYAHKLIREGADKDIITKFEGQMVDHFGEMYGELYGKSVDDVANKLLPLLDTVDVAGLNLTDNELEAAKKQYEKRVKDFSASFAEQITKIEGETLEVRDASAKPHIEMVKVTESEHTRIVSELNCWTKAQEEFPVRVFKTWHARPDACAECADLSGIKIDVTALFINNHSDEIYEVQGGGLHQRCRCYVQYEMEKEK